MDEQALADLPRTFTYSEAREHGLSDRRIYALRDAGLLESIGRGLYQRTDLPDESDTDLLEIALHVKRATLCLMTALARHDLTDVIPASIDVAVPRGRRIPRSRALVTWHTFAAGTFDIGRDELMLDDSTVIGLYNPMRCIIDVFRLRHLESTTTAIEALRRWLRRRDAQPARLLAMARSFPQAEPALISTLDVLL